MDVAFADTFDEAGRWGRVDRLGIVVDAVASRRLLEPASMLGDLPRLLEPLLPDDGDGMTPSARRMRRLAGVNRALGLRERLVVGLNGLADDEGVPSGVRKYARGSGCKGRRLFGMVANAGARLLVVGRVVFC